MHVSSFGLVGDNQTKIGIDKKRLKDWITADWDNVRGHMRSNEAYKDFIALEDQFVHVQVAVAKKSASMRCMKFYSPLDFVRTK